MGTVVGGRWRRRGRRTGRMAAVLREEEEEEEECTISVPPTSGTSSVPYPI